MGENAGPELPKRRGVKEVRPPGAEEAAQDITRDVRAFTAAIRNRIFSFIRSLVNADFEQALENLGAIEDAEGQPWTAERLKRILEDYYLEHEHICLDPDARNLRHTYVIKSTDNRSWRVQQMLIDPEENNDWVAEFEVDLVQSRAQGTPRLRLQRIGSLSLSSPKS
jgi:hypothetical protein